MSEIPLEASGRIDTDVKCVGCDYNLRGLDGEAVCPECGVAVERSLRGEFLQFANPQWVGQLSRGMSLAWLSLIMAFFVGLSLASGIGVVLHSHPIATVAVGGMLLSPVGVAFAACWCFSVPEPGAKQVENSRDWRAIARASAVILVIVILVLCVCARGIVWNSKAGDVVFVGSFYIGVIASVVGFYAAGRYAAGLARRIPNQHLASHTMFVTFGGTLVGLSILFGISLLIFVPLASNSFSLFSSGPSLPPILEMILVFGALATMVGGAVFGLGVLIMMARFYYALQNAAELAKGGGVEKRANVQT